VLGAAISAIDVYTPVEVIANLLESVDEIGVDKNGRAFAALTLEFVQFEVLGQLDAVGSIVGFYHDEFPFLCWLFKI
jgi:hypothetical protein